MNRLPLLLLSALFLNPVPLRATTGDDLTEAQRRQLAQDKILIGTEEFRQSFEPYIKNDVPIFVTSDALLNAFHVLFEESLTRMEAANVPKLETFLEKILTKLPEAAAELKGVPDATRQSAVDRAEIMMKTAFRLLGRPAAGSNAGIEQTIAAQVKEIEAATGSRKPEWLGPPDPGFLALDFTRYTPRGFYADSILLQRYFRSVSWLQSVPFRVLRDEEYLAAKVIGRAAWLADPADVGDYDQLDSFLTAWTVFLGEGDDYSLTNLIPAGRDAEGLAFGGARSLNQMKQEEIIDRRKERWQQINDTLLSPPADPFATAPPDPDAVDESAAHPRQAADEAFRLLSAAALPDAVLFQKTSDLGRDVPPRYPSPLEVAAGMGSDFAKAMLARELSPKVWAKVEPSIQWLAGRKTGPLLYDAYLGVLRELVNAQEPEVPDFFLGDPWQRKSCQTLLASWTQMRHALVLQAKTVEHYASATRLPPGFVEPDPEFFRRLGELSTRCLVTFAGASAFEDNAEVVIFSDLYRGRNLAALAATSVDGMDLMPWNDFARARDRAQGIGSLPEEPEYPRFENNTPDLVKRQLEKAYHQAVSAYFGKTATILTEVIQKLESAEPSVKASYLAKLRLSGQRGMPSRWQGLASICSQAQSIAHRQLRKVPLTKEEETFLRNFGKKLAAAMFYDGNSYVSPRDDAPRVVDVFSGPQGHLHVGIGRPRVLYVLYPWQGKEVLCVGSVLPFHEFIHGPERLTDDLWMKKLTEAPLVSPKWIQPIMGR